MMWFITCIWWTNSLTLQRYTHTSLCLNVVDIVTRRTKHSFNNLECFRCMIKININFISYKSHLRRRMVRDKSWRDYRRCWTRSCVLSNEILDMMNSFVYTLQHVCQLLGCKYIVVFHHLNTHARIPRAPVENDANIFWSLRKREI